MLAFSDDRWRDLRGGYRTRFDPRPLLEQLASGRGADRAWPALWDGLHHQGDVDTASYASVPHLVKIHQHRDVPDWNAFGLMCCIEIERHRSNNPTIPDFLVAGYEEAWREVVPLALNELARSDDELLVRASLAVIALARGLKGAGEVLFDFDEGELADMVSLYRGV